MNIIYQDTKYSLLCFEPYYKRFIKEVIYTGFFKSESIYNDVLERDLIKISLSDYIIDKLYFSRFKDEQFLSVQNYDFYAYGLLTNTKRTNIILLDFDKGYFVTHSIFNEVNDIINTVNKFKDVIYGIDIIESSPNKYHVHIGLNNIYDISNMFGKFNTLCYGYKCNVLNRQEALLRISQKFLKNGSYTKPPKVAAIYRYHDEKLICSSNCVYPTPNIQKPEVLTKEPRRLNLRK